MAIFFDVLLVAIMVLTVIKHFRLGLACSVLSALRFVFALIVAVLLCYPVATLLYNMGVSSALSGILAFAVLFVAALILSRLLIKALSKIKIPIITKIDKLLGLVLGLVLGSILVSITSTALYTVLELAETFGGDHNALRIYEDSYVFKFVYELKLFDFIRNLF